MAAGRPTHVAQNRPEHIHPDMIVDFDIYDLPGGDLDIHAGLLHFQRGGYPDIFWTPRNGGHWVVTRAEDVRVVHSDNSRFLSRRVSVPKPPEDAPQMIPLESDPPRHGDLRRPVARALMPKMIDAIETKVRERTIALIESFVNRGACEFVGEFCQVLPVAVFLDLVDLPASLKDVFLPLVDRASRGQTAEARALAQGEIQAMLSNIVAERRRAPDVDLISQITAIDVAGRTITHEETTAYATLLLIAGLDTTLSLLALAARFLATHPTHRAELIARLDDKTFLRNAVEELVRLGGAVTVIGREIAEDFEFKGMPFRKGEMILAPAIYAGHDEQRVANPETVDFGRKFPIYHATFGAGPHICPGQFLARRELQIFLEEWLVRIPNFEITPGTQPRFASGAVCSVLNLDLSWPRPSSDHVD